MMPPSQPEGPRPAWPAALAWGLGLVGGVAALEGALQLMRRGSTGRRCDHRLFCEADPVLGWTKIPNYAATRTTSEYTVREHFNADGLRGPEWPIERSSGVYRVLVLGDSFVEGYGVPYEQLCTEVLARELHAALGRRVEVINAGTGGYGTDQEVLFFETRGIRYAPDLTILVFYDNDVLENTRACVPRAPKPQFALRDDGTLALVRVDAGPPAAEGWSPARTAARLLIERSRLWQTVKQGAFNWALVGGLVLRRWRARLGYQAPQDFWRWIAQDTEAVAAAYELAGALLRRLRDSAARAGSELLVVYAPSQPFVVDRLWRLMWTHWGFGEKGFTRTQIGERLQEICRRSGIACVDTTPSLRAAALQGVSPYYPLDGHWNATGHQVVGQLLARHVLPFVRAGRAEMHHDLPA